MSMVNQTMFVRYFLNSAKTFNCKNVRNNSALYFVALSRFHTCIKMQDQLHALRLAMSINESCVFTECNVA